VNKRLEKVINRNSVFIPFLFLLVLLTVLYPQDIKDYHRFIDWKTIVTLTGLLVTTTAIKESSYFFKIARLILKGVNSERELALYLILLSSLLSMFLTNDIALFVVVPLTLTLQKCLHNDVKKLIIFEAIAVNVGSSLTPIGNPQNLFLWHQWDITFLDFIVKMFPLFAILLSVLVVFLVFSFSSIKLSLKAPESNVKIKSNLLFLSFLLLIAFILAIEFELSYYALLIIFLIYLFFFQRCTIKG